MITKISAYIMPFVILIIVGYGMYKKSDNYDNFVNGAEDGMRTVVSIAPTLIGLMVAVGVLRASGFLDFIAELLSGVCGKLGIPASIVPLIIVRLFSSSAATGLSLDIFKQFGIYRTYNIYTYGVYRNSILHNVSILYGGSH